MDCTHCHNPYCEPTRRRRFWPCATPRSSERAAPPIPSPLSAAAPDATCSRLRPDKRLVQGQGDKAPVLSQVDGLTGAHHCTELLPLCSCQPASTHVRSSLHQHRWCLPRALPRRRALPSRTCWLLRGCHFVHHQRCVAATAAHPYARSNSP
jgi:hypothetical protein